MRYFTLLTMICFILAATAEGTTYVVNPEGTGDFPTIQAAIDAAQDGDVNSLMGHSLVTATVILSISARRSPCVRRAEVRRLASSTARTADRDSPSPQARNQECWKV